MTSNSTNHSNTSRVEEITAVLRTEILLGQYRPGERLPSERDLATRFEANRGAVREALKKLEQLGIADIKPGGVRVVPIEDATLEVLGHLLDLDEIPNPQLIAQLFEVFGALTAMAVRTGIERATDAQLEQMSKLVDQLVSSENSHEEHQQNWKAFGDYLSEVNDNLVLRLIGNGLKTQFVGRLEKIGLLLNPERPRDTSNLEALKQAMSERDGEQASSVIRSHFRATRDFIVEALGEAEADSERRVTHG